MSRRTLVVLTLVFLTILMQASYLVFIAMTIKPTDINSDGVVDIKDVALAAAAFGSASGHIRWNTDADINEDGRISLKDIALIVTDFGTTLP